MRVVVGLASGIGNVCFMLPALRALYEQGHEVVAYVAGDYQMCDLLRRCRYLSEVVDASAHPVPDADRYVSGHWCAPTMMRRPGLEHARFTNEPHYPCPEWMLPFHRWAGLAPAEPDVRDWCTGLDRTPRWDVAIVAGCKPGSLWARKTYPWMCKVAGLMHRLGRRVVWLGQPDDAPQGGRLWGENRLGRYSLAQLPDALAGCRVVIGTDSGPTHLASSLGVPVVVLYTATSTTKGDPVGRPAIKLRVESLTCSPCQATARWHQCSDWQCRSIPVSAVMDAAGRLLGEGKDTWRKQMQAS